MKKISIILSVLLLLNCFSIASALQSSQSADKAKTEKKVKKPVEKKEVKKVPVRKTVTKKTTETKPAPVNSNNPSAANSK